MDKNTQGGIYFGFDTQALEQGFALTSFRHQYFDPYHKSFTSDLKKDTQKIKSLLKRSCSCKNKKVFTLKIILTDIYQATNHELYMIRRSFIQLSAFAAAAISFPLLYSCSYTGREHAISQPVFLSRLFDEHTIRDAGKAYIQKTPSESSEDKLIALLADNSSIAASTDEKSIHDYLDKKIKQDFETGNTVLVKGWVLAVTEARQCALFSLINS